MIIEIFDNFECAFNVKVAQIMQLSHEYFAKQASNACKKCEKGTSDIYRTCRLLVLMDKLILLFPSPTKVLEHIEKLVPEFIEGSTLLYDKFNEIWAATKIKEDKE